MSLLALVHEGEFSSPGRSTCCMDCLLYVFHNIYFQLLQASALFSVRARQTLSMLQELQVPPEASWETLTVPNCVYFRFSHVSHQFYVGATTVGLVGRELSRIRKFSQRWLTYLELGVSRTPVTVSRPLALKLKQKSKNDIIFGLSW